MIRKAKESDCPYLHNIYKSLNLGGSPLVTPTCINLINQNPLYAIYVYEESAIPVGTATVYACPDPSTGLFFGIIDYVAVLPTFRKNGIGKKLITEAEKFCKEKGCYAIKIITRSDNQNAIKFYESLGYDSSGRVTLRKKM